MARLNIEDQFWLDLISVTSKFSNHDEAIGNAIRFFRHAQEKHKQGELITEAEFKFQGFSEHLFGLFAERIEGGIRAVDSEKHFDWLKGKVEAGRTGGRISAQRPRNKEGQLLPKQKPSTRQAKPNTDQASPSPSPSLELNTKAKKPPAPPAPLVDQKGNPVVTAYIAAWSKKHRVRPPLLPADMKKLKTLGEQFGPSQAVSLVEEYFKVPNRWFNEKRHDVETLMKNLTVIAEHSLKKAPTYSNSPPPMHSGPDPRDIPEEERAAKMAEMRNHLNRIPNLKKQNGVGA